MFEDGFQIALEFGKVIGERVPHLVKVNPKIVVNQHVSLVHNIGPRNMRMPLLQCFGEAAGGLSNNLDVVNGPNLEEFVPKEELAV